MNGWFLQEITIEGFRGINNESQPLTLKFKPDSVNSISAPNGVGKSSIFDALLYAITGEIPKLDGLPATEKGPSYYLNRFHGGGVGTIALTLLPAAGGEATTVTVSRDSTGNRTVSASAGVDGDAVLAELNREFVLLDGNTFRHFIDHKPLERGRSFAGLLGLRRYSLVRQALITVANTRSFNNHFNVRAIETERDAGKTAAERAGNNIKEAYQALVGEVLDPALSADEVMAKAFAALHGIELLKPHCEGKTFEEIDPSACVNAAKAAEGGDDRDKLAKILRDETAWTEALAAIPDLAERDRLVELADTRDAALAKTQGDTFRQLYALSEQILMSETWQDKSICPACDAKNGTSVLDHMRQKTAAYASVTAATNNLVVAWSKGSWTQLKPLEQLAARSDEPKQIQKAEKPASEGMLNGTMARELNGWLAVLADRAKSILKELVAAKMALEKSLPPKLTAVVEKAEAARRLQTNIRERRDARAVVAAHNETLTRIARVKGFLDKASARFAEAESMAASRRLAAIEPKCREYFAAIMFEDVVPALSKRAGTEELSISLAEFWTLENISAQAVLSESFRNAFAISVYLAAASLYAGGAKFLILDDVTSSFDSGHQFHLMNVIREKFARPGIVDGPQVILLSHDTVLEKLFNSNSNAGEWWHQCIQGTPRTAVLPQSGAVTKIRDATIALLDAGNVDEAAPRIRQYLEFKLQEVISKVGIPVPMTLAFNDDKHMAKNLLDAIKRAVDLHEAAKQLILASAQQSGMTTAVATIVSNYVSHWSTGQTHAFTAGSLKGVMSAIDAFGRCFQYENPAGSGQFRYYKSLAAK